MQLMSPPGRKLLVALAAASFGLGIAGCDGDKSSSSSSNGPGFDTVKNPVGKVSGAVVDQNGKPLAGVTVAVGGKSAVTDINGQVLIDAVPVTGTSSADNSGGNGGPLTVTLRAPAGYLGATSFVFPSAQLSCTDVTDEDSTTTNPQCVFIDGFAVSFSTIVLPQLNSRVTGTLRDSSTGQPVSGATVELDFRSVQPDQPVGFGVEVAYDHPGIAASTTTADGSFNFTGVGADSCFEISRTGHDLDSQGESGTDIGCEDEGEGPDDAIVSNGVLVNTNREGANTGFAGSLLSTPAANADEIAPFVSDVSSVLDTRQIPGVLSVGVDGTGGITFTLSEAITTALTSAHIQIVKGTAPNQSIVPFDLTASTTTSFTIALEDGLAAGEEITVRVKRNQAVDASGNMLGEDEDSNEDPNYDRIWFDSKDGENVEFRLKAFSPFAGAPGAVVLTQVTDNQNDDVTAPFRSSSAFLDSLEKQTNTSDETSPSVIGTGSENISQLNSKAPVASGQPDPLEALLDFVATNGDFYRTTARVTVDLSGAAVKPASIAVALYRDGAIVAAGDNPGQVGFYTISTPASVDGEVNPDGAGPLKSITNGGEQWYVVTPNGDGVFDLVVRNAKPGDELRAVSRNADKQVGGEARLVLEDIVPATTVLSPLADDLFAISSNLAAINISAGGAIGDGINDRHLVVLPISPQSLDVSDSENGFINDDLKGEIGSANATYAVAGGTTDVTSDATAMAAFTGANVRLGVAFSEPLGALLGTPATPGFTTVFSSYDVRNDQAAEDGHRFSFVTFNVNNVFTTEADGRGGPIMNFAGVVQDAAAPANVSDEAANARVLVRDVMPPLMTKAYRNAQGLTFTFHEPVRLSAGAINLLDCGATIDIGQDQTGEAAVADRITLSGDGRTVTVPLTNSQFPANASACFPDVAATTYAESAYDGLGAVPAGTALRHGRVTYGEVRDQAQFTVQGEQFPNNYWNAWAALNLGMAAPTFAAADLVGPFIATGVVCEAVFADGAAADTVFDCDVGFSHPIDGGSFLNVIATPGNYLRLEDGAGVSLGATVGPASARIGTASASGVCVAATETCNVVRVQFTTTAATVTGNRVHMPGDANVFLSAFDNGLAVGRTADALATPSRTAFRDNVGNGGVAP